MVIKFEGEWEILRNMGNMDYVDFHYMEGMSYYEKLSHIHSIVMQTLKNAQNEGIDYVLFNHGYSPSQPFIGTPRSIVRSIMRSKESAPFIIKKKSIQHNSVFVAAIKPKI